MRHQTENCWKNNFQKAKKFSNLRPKSAGDFLKRWEKFTRCILMGCKRRYSILHFPICFHKKQSTKKIGKTALSSEQPCLFWITYNASNESLSLHCSCKPLAKYAVPPLISSAVFLHLLLSNTMPCAFHLSPSRNRHFFERLVLMIVELNASNRIFHIYMDTSRFLLQSVHTMRKILHLLLKNTR